MPCANTIIRQKKSARWFCAEGNSAETDGFPSHTKGQWLGDLIFSLLLCEGNSAMACGFPSQRPVMGSLNVLFVVSLNTLLRKQSMVGDTTLICNHCNTRIFSGLGCLAIWVLLSEVASQRFQAKPCHSYNPGWGGSRHVINWDYYSTV